MYKEKSRREWTKKNVTIYLEVEDINLLDDAAGKDHLSRNKLIESVIKEHIKSIKPMVNDNIKEDIENEQQNNSLPISQD